MSWILFFSVENICRIKTLEYIFVSKAKYFPQCSWLTRIIFVCMCRKASVAWLFITLLSTCRLAFTPHFFCLFCHFFASFVSFLPLLSLCLFSLCLFVSYHLIVIYLVVVNLQACVHSSSSESGKKYSLAYFFRTSSLVYLLKRVGYARNN